MPVRARVVIGPAHKKAIELPDGQSRLASLFQLEWNAERSRSACRFKTQWVCFFMWKEFREDPAYQGLRSAAANVSRRGAVLLSAPAGRTPARATTRNRGMLGIPFPRCTAAAVHRGPTPARILRTYWENRRPCLMHGISSWRSIPERSPSEAGSSTRNLQTPSSVSLTRPYANGVRKRSTQD